MKWIKVALLMLALGLSFNALAINEDDEMAFKNAIEAGNVKEIDKFVKAEPTLVNEKFFGWSPLQIAVNYNKIEVAKYFLSKGADINYVQPNAHHSAYMLAALNRQKEMTTFLAKAGANVNEKLKGGVSLVRYFRDEGDKEMLDLVTQLGTKDDGCQEECF